MNFEYKVLDNFIPETYQNILTEIYDTSIAQWAYLPSLSDLSKDEIDINDSNIVPSFAFTQKVYRADKNYTNHNWNFTAPMLWFLEHRTGVKIKSIERVHSNLMVPTGANANTYNEPHIDHPSSDCLTMIYYVNDADGDTRLFNKTVDEGFKNLKLIHSQPPSKGTAMIFPSNRFHSSSCPINATSRVILNFVMHIENAFEV